MWSQTTSKAGWRAAWAASGPETVQQERTTAATSSAPLSGSRVLGFGACWACISNLGSACHPAWGVEGGKRLVGGQECKGSTCCTCATRHRACQPCLICHCRLAHPRRMGFSATAGDRRRPVNSKAFHQNVNDSAWTNLLAVQSLRLPL